MSKKLSNDKGITKSNRKSVIGSMTGEISTKKTMADNSMKHQEDLNGFANQAVGAPNINWSVQIIQEKLQKKILIISKVVNVWKLNPSSRTITLKKLLIKHANFTKKETEIGA